MSIFYLASYYSKIKYKYRFDPVPFVRKRKRGGYWKRIKTTNERRLNCIHEFEGFTKLIRRKRSYKKLPNAWDDERRTKQRTWKSNRKTQYKGLVL